MMLCWTVDGHELPTYIGFKRETLPKGILFPSGVILFVDEKGWLDKCLVLDLVDNM